MSLPRPIADERPAPPLPPDLEDCCRSGCEPCIFDLFDQAMERYRAELDAWEQRQAPSSRSGSRLRR